MIARMERTWDDHIIFYLGEHESFLAVDNVSEELLLEYMEYLRDQMTLAKQYSSKRIYRISDENG